MASLSTDSAGRRRIQFVDTNGKRRAVRLGKVSMREASEIKTKIEAIVEAQTAMISLDRETAKWLNKIGNVLYGKLVAVDLASPRESVDRVKLLEFINGYIDARVDIKPGTVEQLEVARKHLVDFFGGAKPIARITNGDADEFRQHLFSIMGSENTARRLCGRAKQLFRYAARKRLIEESPFADMKGNGVKSNMDRAVFVTRETIAKVLDVCPDIQWRLLVALARYGGLRCPSEPLALRWGDVDWERGRLRVSSPKTEHHEGKAFRWIPIFPELRPVMDDAYALAPDDGTEHIITRYRDPRVNLRTQFERIVRKAGVEPWAKPWQNLRSTRETELAETYPIHVVCAWIGNSEAVARNHYLQVTDEHFEKAAQNPAQSASERAGNAGKAGSENADIAEDFRPLPACTHVQAPR